MAQGSGRPGGHPGSNNSVIPELFDGDPSVSPGLARSVGWRVYDGSQAWDKYGPGDTDWILVGPTGGFLTFDVDWFEAQKRIFSFNTQLNPFQWAAETSLGPSEDFNAANNGWLNDTIVTGDTGAVAVPAAIGSTMQLKGTLANTAGVAQWYPGAGVGSGQQIADQIISVRQRRWMTAYRVGVAGSLASGNPFCLGLVNISYSASPIYVHRLGLGSPEFVPNAHWHLTLDDTSLFDTGVPILSGSNGFDFMVTIYVACFDFVNMVVAIQPTSLDDFIVAAPMDSVGDISGRPFIGILSGGANLIQQQLFVDKAIGIKEL